MTKTKRTFRKINKRKNNKSKKRVPKRNTRKMKGGSDFEEMEKRARFREYTQRFKARYRKYPNLMKFCNHMSKDDPKEIFSIIPYYGPRITDYVNETLSKDIKFNNEDYWPNLGWKLYGIENEKPRVLSEEDLRKAKDEWYKVLAEEKDIMDRVKNGENLEEIRSQPVQTTMSQQDQTTVTQPSVLQPVDTKPQSNLGKRERPEEKSI